MASIFDTCMYMPLVMVAIMMISVVLIIAKRVMSKTIEFDKPMDNDNFMQQENFHPKDIYEEDESFRSTEDFVYDQTAKQYCSYCHGALTGKGVFGFVKCEVCGKRDKIRR